MRKDDQEIKFMNALTDLPDDMILEAAWKEDEAPAGRRSRRWLPILISAAAALVIGFISWGIASGRPQVEPEATTATEAVTDEEPLTGVTDREKISEDVNKGKETGKEVSPGFSAIVPFKENTESAQQTESTEAKVTETTKPAETTETTDATDRGNGSQTTDQSVKPADNTNSEKQKSADDPTDDQQPEYYSKSDAPEKEATKKPDFSDAKMSDASNKETNQKQKDKYEAEDRILNHVDPDHNLIMDRENGYLNLPDSFAGTTNDQGDGLMHVYATSEEALEDYKKVLEDYPVVVYHSVEYSYRDLKAAEAVIREHQNAFDYMKTSVSVAENRVFVDVDANDYEKMQELVQDLPVVVRINEGTDRYL